MQLTLYTDYSLRVLMYLAASEAEITTISDIASKYGISKNHLVKVAHNLGKLGYIHAIRGRSGGVRLAVSPKDVGLGEVVRQVEPSFVLVECFEETKGNCPILPVCRLRGILRDAQDAFMQVLDNYTLSDLVSNRAALLDLLQVPGTRL